MPRVPFPTPRPDAAGVAAHRCRQGKVCPRRTTTTRRRPSGARHDLADDVGKIAEGCVFRLVRGFTNSHQGLVIALRLTLCLVQFAEKSVDSGFELAGLLAPAYHLLGRLVLARHILECGPQSFVLG